MDFADVARVYAKKSHKETSDIYTKINGKSFLFKFLQNGFYGLVL